MISVLEAINAAKTELAYHHKPVNEAELLMMHALGCKRMELYLNHKKIMEQSPYDSFMSYIERRKNHEPLSYIIGQRPFYKSFFKVTPETFIPRSESELLVEKAVSYLTNQVLGEVRLLEIGTGCGAISISIAKEMPCTRIDATDISSSALKVAKENALIHHCESQIQFFHGDLYEALPKDAKYHLIVCNPPYIPSERIPSLDKEVIAEPANALDGGFLGLDIIFRLISGALHWMHQKALLLFEIDGAMQIPYITAMMRKHHFRSVFWEKDMSGLPRIVGGYYQ